MPSQQILGILAQILRETGADVERLGAVLCEDESVAMRYCDALQTIDVIAQRQLGIAQFLEDHCRQEAIESVTLEALQARLRLHTGDSGTVTPC